MLLMMLTAALHAVPAAPATNAAPNAGPAAISVDSSSAAAESHGLSKVAIAGIVIGCIAAAALLSTLVAFVVIKVPLPLLHANIPACILHTSMLKDAVLLA